MKEMFHNTIGRLKTYALKAGYTFKLRIKHISGMRVCRQINARFAYYTALVTVLILLAAASYAYRASDEMPAQETTIDFPKTAAAVIIPEPSATPEAPVVQSPRFVWPVEGEIIGEFAPDKLIWSETLRQWQTHPGTDISVYPGEAVLACSDGIVQDVYSDPLWGNVIIITHDNGYVSTYANVETIRQVSVGEKVKAGDIISAVGQSAIAESGMPAHLHMEFRDEAGLYVDFSAFMREKGF